MPYYSVTAVNPKNGKPCKVEFFLGGKSRGFTSDRRGQALTFEISGSGNYDWYAKRHGKKVDSGRSSGGTVKVMAD